MNEQYTPREVGMIDTPRQLCWLRFSHDDSLLLGGGYDGLIRRWTFDGTTPTEIDPLRGFRGWAQAFALHPEKPLLYAADSWGRLACYAYADEDPQAMWELDAAHDGWIRSLAITPDGRRLASAGNDRHVRVFDAETGKPIREIRAGDDDLFAVAIHPDGQSVVSGDLFCRLKAWNVETGELLREFDATKMHFYDRDQDVCGLRGLRFLDEGKTVLAAGAEPTRTGLGHGIPVIYFYDWETGKQTRRLEQGDANDGFIDDLVMHPAGFFMTVTIGQPGKGKLIFQRPEADKPFVEYTKMSNTHSLALNSDGSRFVVAATNRRSQGNGAVKDENGNYVGNYSPLHLFDFGG